MEKVTMIIRTCLECKFHKIRHEDECQSSYCGKERCWSVYTKCLTQKAVERFLVEECRAVDGSQILNAAAQ